MIEEDGIKVAENDDEAYWERKRVAVSAVIKDLEDGLRLNEAIQDMINAKLKEAIKE
jgi:hypothetical protein